MPTNRSPKQVRVHADGCTPENLELFKDKDGVVFVQGDPHAPKTIHVDNPALFGTTTCSVGALASEATVYLPKIPGNYTIGISTAAVKQPGAKGTVQVLCLGLSGALGAADSGTIKVTR